MLTSCSIQRVKWENLQTDIKLSSTTELLACIAHDSLMGREPGTKGFEKAAGFVEMKMRGAKLNKVFSSYKDSFYIEKTLSYNLVGSLGRIKKKKPIVVLGAHLDHLGMRETGRDKIYNGANDDASGVVAVLQIMEALKKHHTKQNVLFALFSGEESGLLGSNHLAKRLKNEGYSISYMLNFEMLGKTLSGKENQAYLTGFQLSDLGEKVNELMDTTFLINHPAAVKNKLFYRSDNYSFYKAFNIPAHTVSSFDFKNDPYYHDVQDEWEHLDIENFNRLVQSSAWMVVRLLQENTTVSLVKH